MFIKGRSTTTAIFYIGDDPHVCRVQINRMRLNAMRLTLAEMHERIEGLESLKAIFDTEQSYIKSQRIAIFCTTPGIPYSDSTDDLDYYIKMADEGEKKSEALEELLKKAGIAIKSRSSWFVWLEDHNDLEKAMQALDWDERSINEIMDAYCNPLSLTVFEPDGEEPLQSGIDAAI